MRSIHLAPGIKDHLLKTFSRDDLHVIGTTLLDIAKNGEGARECNRYGAVTDLGFPCREVEVLPGRKGIGLLTVYSLEIAETELTVLYAKEGGLGNLSIKEKNEIREAYRAEMERRG